MFRGGVIVEVIGSAGLGAAVKSVLITRALAARFTGGGTLLTDEGGPIFVLIDMFAKGVGRVLTDSDDCPLPPALPRGEGDLESDIAPFGDVGRLGIRKCPLDDCSRGEGGAGTVILKFDGTARGTSFGGDLGDVMSTRGADDCVAGGGRMGAGRVFGGGVTGRLRGLGGSGGTLFDEASDCVDSVRWCSRRGISKD